MGQGDAWRGTSTNDRTRDVIMRTVRLHGGLTAPELLAKRPKAIKESNWKNMIKFMINDGTFIIYDSRITLAE